MYLRHTSYSPKRYDLTCGTLAGSGPLFSGWGRAGGAGVSLETAFGQREAPSFSLTGQVANPAGPQLGNGNAPRNKLEPINAKSLLIMEYADSLAPEKRRGKDKTQSQVKAVLPTLVEDARGVRRAQYNYPAEHSIDTQASLIYPGPWNDPLLISSSLPGGRAWHSHIALYWK